MKIRMHMRIVLKISAWCGHPQSITSEMLGLPESLFVIATDPFNQIG